MPASIAWAMGAGIAAMRRPSRGHRPVAMMSAATMRNPPTAAGQPPRTMPVLASSAAPGVDQAAMIGIRCRSDSQMVMTPATRLRASRPEAAWAGEAPTPRSPATMTANELVTPTRAARIPAVTGWLSRAWRVAGGSISATVSHHNNPGAGTGDRALDGKPVPR
jgi:hypothetical protein